MNICDFTIDGKSALQYFGIRMAKTGAEKASPYGDIVCFPSMKEIKSNDWPEENGIQPDLSNPRLEAQNFSIAFSCSYGIAGYGDFMNVLKSDVYHLFDFGIGRSLKLRLTGENSIAAKGEASVFELKFAKDSPFDDGYSYSSPFSSMVLPARHAFKIDGTDIRRYGCYLTSGFREEILKEADVKPNLTQSSRDVSGAVYDGAGGVRFKSRDVSLPFFMCAKKYPEFWNNYDALLYNLTRAGSRRFSFGNDGYDCFYKSCSVKEFSAVGGAWFQFGLNMVFINN